MSQELMDEMVNMSFEIIKLKDQRRELLEALKRCQKQLQGLSFKDQDIVLAIERAYTAILQAEGITA